MLYENPHDLNEFGIFWTDLLWNYRNATYS